MRAEIYENRGMKCLYIPKRRRNRGEACMRRAMKGTRTKRKLADALKDLLETRPLERVRVHHLTDRCEIHRQTFYYHFTDVYQLLDWTVQEDGAALAARLAEAPDWRTALETLLQTIPPRRGWFLGILNQASPESRRMFFRGLLAPIAGKAATPDPGGVSDILLSLLEKWIRDGCGPAPEGMAVLLEQMADRPGREEAGVSG